MTRTLIAVTILLPVLAVAQSQEDQVGERAMLVQERTKAVVENLKEEEKKQIAHLRRLRNGTVKMNARGVMIPVNNKQRIIFPSWDAKKKAIADAQARLETLKDRVKRYKKGAAFYYGVLDYPPKIGDFGTLYAGTTGVNVKQVLDEETMLINVYYLVRTTHNPR